MFRLLYCSLLLVFSSCSIPLPEPEARSFYVIRDVPEATPEVSSKVPLVLRVREAQTNHLIGSKRIVFSSDSQTRGYYQFAMWAELPQKRLESLLEQTIDKSGLFKAVVAEESGARADLELQTELVDFFHRVEKEPGEARIKLRAELIDLRSREVLGKREFNVAQKVESFDVAGATEGLEKGLDRILTDMVGWLDRTCAEL